MPVPALVIGLGGTGAIVATYIKKELMESTQKWPLKEVRILAYDTDTDAAKSARIGTGSKIRIAGSTTGGVQLRNGGEFFYVGGNVKSLVEQVASGQHKHIGQWLQAETYLKDLALPDNMYNLNVGAGQFRQFGRMAIFKDMNDASARRVFNTLSDAMVKIKQKNPTLKNLEVFIVGSVAGGTGAGMFADVAHLVRAIATMPNVQLKDKLSIRGYLVLPEAFSQTVRAEALKAMHARAYAAMRENRRFTINFDYERGYPMHYRETGSDPIWNGAIKGQLFDLLYYIDGQGGQAATTSLKNGVAPSLADAISAAIDGDAGPAFSSYVVNVKAVYANRIGRGMLPPKTATFGSLGTYSIVFPIYHIVEKWTHDLGRQLLDHLLVPTEFDPRSNIPMAIAANQNPEEPNEDGGNIGFDFLHSQQAISFEYVDEQGTTRGNSVEPTLLPQQLWYIASEARRGSSGILPELIERKIDDWQAHFMPEGQDEESRRLLDRVKTTLNSRLYHPKEGGEVMATGQSKQKKKEEPAAAADRIVRGTRAYTNRYLGAPARSGRRSGGLYRKAMAEIMTYHMDRFVLRLDIYILSTLNGYANNPQTVAKHGKIGFLNRFLDELFMAIDLVRVKLQEAQDQRRELGQGYLATIAKVESTKKNMLDAAEKKKGILANRAATNAQHNYLQAEVEQIELLKVEATEESILHAVRNMLDYVRSAQESLQSWIDTLARNTKGLYKQVVDGRVLIDNDRRTIQDATVRLIVTDNEYEKTRYQNYLERVDEGWENRLLGMVQWRIKHRQVAGQPKLELAFSLGNSHEDQFSFKPDTPQENLNSWLSLCRKPFARAYEEESVLSYLMQHRHYRNADYLAEEIHGNGGIMLNVDGGDPLPGNFLRAYYLKDSATGQIDYLRGVVNRLAGLSGFSISQEDMQASAEGEEDRVNENKFVQFVNSEDRFKFTFVFTQELIQLNNIVSYKTTGQDEYMGTAKGNRSIMHIFPAEVNATRYEGRLGEVGDGQDIRLFDNEVTVQLEDLARVKLFLLCYVYGLIRQDSVVQEATGERLNVWKLYIEPEKAYNEFGDPTSIQEIYLNVPQTSPHILDALATFNYEEKDARYKDGYVITIDYKAVSGALRRARDADVVQRLEAGIAGQHTPNLLGQIDSVNADVRQTILEDLAQIDRIREYQNRFRKQILPILKKRKIDNPIEQKDYDMVSVFVLMLDEEVRSVSRTVKNRLRALRDLGQPPSGEPATQTDLSKDDLWDAWS